jgi:hypothetical protein
MVAVGRRLRIGFPGLAPAVDAHRIEATTHTSVFTYRRRRAARVAIPAEAFMSRLTKFREAVSSVARRIGGGVALACNVVAEPVSDLVEIVGHAMQDGLDAVGGAAGAIPGAGDVIKGLFRWLGGIVGGVCIVTGAVVKGLLGALGGGVGGAIRVVGGLVTFHGGLVLMGLGDVASSAIAAILVPGAKALGLVQTVLFVQAVERRLTSDEVSMLKGVFQDTLALYNVRLVVGRCGVFAVSDRPFTLGNTILMKRVDPKVEPETVVHESTHVWQYHHVGARYASDALGSQAALPDAYDWEAEIKRGNAEWPQFNKESQAQFIQYAWLEGERTTSGITNTGQGVFFGEDGPHSTGRFVHNAVDQTDRANRAVKTLRGVTEVRLSAVWS